MNNLFLRRTLLATCLIFMGMGHAQQVVPLQSLPASEVQAQVVPVIKTICRWVGRALVCGSGAVGGAAACFYTWRFLENQNPQETNCADWATTCTANAQNCTSEGDTEAYKRSFCSCMGVKPECAAVANAMGDCGFQEAAQGAN